MANALNEVVVFKALLAAGQQGADLVELQTEVLQVADHVEAIDIRGAVVAKATIAACSWR